MHDSGIGEKLGINAFNKSKALLVLWVLMFLSTFSISLISTPSPYLIQQFVKGEDVERVTSEAIGIFISLGYLALTLGNFVGGFLGDAVSRRAIVFVSMIILAVGCGVFAVASSLLCVYVASFIEMFANGLSLPAIRASVADYSTQSSRGKAYGVFNLSWITAQIPAPLLGGVLAQWFNLRIPFTIALIIAISAAPISMLMKNKSIEKQKAANEANASMEEQAKAASLKEVVLLFSLVGLLNGLMNGVLSPLLRVYPIFRLGADPIQFGLITTVGFAIVTALVQVPGGNLADKFGRKPLVLIYHIGSLTIFFMGFSSSIWMFILFLGMTCAVANLSSPALSAWEMDLVPEATRARVSGIISAINGVGFVIGPVIGSWLWSISMSNAALPFGVAALLCASSLPFYLLLKESKKTVSKTD
jgi:MFS family permease